MTESNYRSMYDVSPDTFPNISEEMDQRACQAMNRTWDVIGFDLLVNEETGKTDYSKTLPRKHVIELVLDADHMSTYGDDFEAANYTIWVSRYKPTHYKRLTKRAFPYARYGW